MTHTDKNSRTTRVSPVKKSSYLPQIEGTRAVAVLLVVVYHVFTEQTAGAVDVFFVLTGFLVVSSLLRRIDRGFAGIKDFLVGLFIRLAPVSLLVLLATYIGSLFFLSPVGINLVHREIIASALYLENWQLIIQGSDYLAREEPPTPVLHFWAMSVQMQFYLGTALVFVLLIGLMGRRFPHLNPRTALTWFFSLVFSLSLIYSVYVTYFVDAARAYFDTSARAWEFSMGALLGLAMSRWPRLAIHWFWGWVGLAGLLAAGALVAPVAPYPGYAALVPTISTVLIILAGQTPKKGSAGALLSTPLMVSLGGVAYTLYLVHWPLLIFYREYVTEDVDFVWALAIIIVSILLSYVLRFAIEKPLLRAKYGRSAPKLLTLTTVPLLVATIALPAGSIWQNNFQVAPGDFIGQAPHVTDKAPSNGEETTAINPEDLIPSLESVRSSAPPVYDVRNARNQRCMPGSEQRDDAGWCIYGVSEGYDYTVALLGASHSAQWLPALQIVAEQENWRILTLVATDCNFVSVHPSRSRYENCELVSERMISETIEMRADAVFTVANEGEEEVSGEPRIEPWRLLDQADIPVFALRDNPWFEEDPSSCVAENLDNPAACDVPRESVLAVNFELGNAPDNVTLIDLTDQWCGPNYCPAVIDNLLLWRDTNHFTAEFSRTLAPALQAAVSSSWEPGETTIQEDVVNRLVGTPSN